MAYVNQQWDSSNPAQLTSTNVCHYDGTDYGALPADYPSFANDVANGNLPMFSIIEPRYYSNWSPANLMPCSNHPGTTTSPEVLGKHISNAGINSTGANNNGSISVVDGEALLMDVLQTLVSNDALDNTLLVVTLTPNARSCGQSWTS